MRPFWVCGALAFSLPVFADSRVSLVRDVNSGQQGTSLVCVDKPQSCLVTRTSRGKITRSKSLASDQAESIFRDLVKDLGNVPPAASSPGAKRALHFDLDCPSLKRHDDLPFDNHSDGQGLKLLLMKLEARLSGALE